MDIQQKKEAIRKRLLLKKYPRRRNADFSTDKDHNPMVLQDCPRCHGSGKSCREELQENSSVAILESCPECNGEGITGHIEPYFKNNSPEMIVVPYIEGWVRCPNCSRKFALKDKNAWTGLRHIKCGQKLKVVTI